MWNKCHIVSLPNYLPVFLLSFLYEISRPWKRETVVDSTIIMFGTMTKNGKMEIGKSPPDYDFEVMRVIP